MLDLDPFYIKIVSQLISDDFKDVPSLTKDDIIACDKVVEKLMLDRLRAVYFARSRQFDQTEIMKPHEEDFALDEKFYFDENW